VSNICVQTEKQNGQVNASIGVEFYKTCQIDLNLAT